MTIRQFIKKLFVTIIMIGIVLAAVLKVGYILICKVIVMIIFAVLAIRCWVGEDIRKAEVIKDEVGGTGKRKKRKGEPGYSRLDLLG